MGKLKMKGGIKLQRALDYVCSDFCSNAPFIIP